MGQLLHQCARTTQAVRREIQLSKESIKTLAKRYGVNPKTIQVWKKRDFVTDLPMGPKTIRSTVLSEAEETSMIAFRKITQLPLDDCLYALQETIPHLTRSSLHRCFQRHGCSRLPKTDAKKVSKKPFKAYPIGYFHIDIAQVQTAEGKLFLFVGIDRTSKFAYAELYSQATKAKAALFLKNLIQAVPYKINKILTDNGVQFTHRVQDQWALPHVFERICQTHSIEHRKTKVKHPWTNGQVERMNRTIKDATVKTFYYSSAQQLKNHLHYFLMAYNFAKRLKALKGFTPWQFILKQWHNQPKSFKIKPHHFISGLNS